MGRYLLKEIWWPISSVVLVIYYTLYSHVPITRQLEFFLCVIMPMQQLIVQSISYYSKDNFNS